MTSWFKEMYRTNFVFMALYAAAVISIFVRSGDPISVSWWVGTVPFFIWCVAPIFLPLIVVRRSWFVTVSVGAIAAYSLNVYVDSMFGPGLRSTSALIFAFLPIYQWIAVGLVLAINFFAIRSQNSQLDGLDD
ncbi:hypothetical protein [Parasphingorhabdus sp.]|uniref:hypothetical protein n=1 Tax=Parasphingorhabdus sp. TaxID=2709688 RepID=UPI0010FCE187